MNPRIYKKQAKRAVELLRSFERDVSDYRLTTEGGVIEPPCGWRRLHRQRSNAKSKPTLRAWDRITGIPTRVFMSCDEWDERDARQDWFDDIYWSLADANAESFGQAERAWPKLSTQQRRTLFSCKRIAPGWRWRGGRALRVVP